MEAYTTGNPFFWIIAAVLLLWLVPALFWGTLMWWAWTRKVEGRERDRLWIGWLEISKAVAFRRFMRPERRGRYENAFNSLEALSEDGTRGNAEDKQ